MYIHTRASHGVTLRSGRHVARSDTKDFESLMKNLMELEAHKVIDGREFGHYVYPENILDDEIFDKSKFYRWIANKNDEAKGIIELHRKFMMNRNS